MDMLTALGKRMKWDVAVVETNLDALHSKIYNPVSSVLLWTKSAMVWMIVGAEVTRKTAWYWPPGRASQHLQIQITRVSSMPGYLVVVWRNTFWLG